MGELAPRDVVSRAIVSEVQPTGGPVFLDLTHLDSEHVRTRFPRIYETCLRCGVDITSQLVPVHPAAHYSMGGVRTDLEGRASVNGLYAAGEVACTGVHGANRLASNSLLEGLVFGARTGRAMGEQAGNPRCDGVAAGAVIPTIDERAVRALAWEKLGIVRSKQSISAALDELYLANERAGRADAAGRAEYELRNMTAVAELIGRCALERRESRGGHYRTDFPEKSSEFQRHSVISSHDGYRLE
jgi:L-aspartate oxidase